MSKKKKSRKEIIDEAVIFTTMEDRNYLKRNSERDYFQKNMEQRHDIKYINKVKLKKVEENKAVFKDNKAEGPTE